MKLQANTILITGGTSGIGFQLAKELIALGNEVIVTGRNEERLARAKSLLPKLHIIKSDVSNTTDIQALVKKVTAEFPKLNVLINNAGIMQTLNFHQENLSDADLSREITINLNGPIRMTHSFLPHLKKQASAAIVNVSSGLAFVPLPTSPIYCATKAALHSFTLSLRVQLQKTNIKVFELAPPATQTELLAGHDSEDMKGIPIMSVEKMVEITLQKMASDVYEICPGPSSQLRMMNRIAPAFILKQLSRSVERMLSK